VKCIIEDCQKESYCKGLCTTHYKRQWRHGEPTKTNTPGRGFQRIKCTAEDDCDNVSDYSNGLCEKHYQMLRVYGRTKRVVNDYGVGGFNLDGYWVITVNSKRVYQHIHLAEKALGKPLPKGAVVHHMNGIKYDNETPYNLVICPDQSYHMLLHKRARELGYENN
jgi:hypothetical protein